MRHQTSLIHIGNLFLGLGLAACAPIGSGDTAPGDSETGELTTGGGTSGTATDAVTTSASGDTTTSGTTSATTSGDPTGTSSGGTTTSTGGDTTGTTGTGGTSTGDTGTSTGTESDTDTGVAETISMVRIGRYAQPDPADAIATYLGDDLSAAEIPAFDPASRRLFVVNGQKSGVDVLDLTDPTAPVLLTTLDTSGFGAPNSVSVHDGVVAVAVEAATKTDPGEVWFFAAATGEKLSAVGVGAVPDMVTFSPDGHYVITADEGEPDSDYLVDPPGSISVIDISGGVQDLVPADVTTADFDAFTIMNLPADVHLSGPNADAPALNLEPEYVAVSGDSTTAYVTLQENNAVAVVDLAAGAVTEVRALGFKDWSAGPRLDPSDKDGAITPVHAPIRGMYQPDAVAWFSVQGGQYLLTANEGDARDWDAYSEEERIKNLTLDPQAFPDAAQLQQDAALGRLRVTSALGDPDADGDHDALYAFGARSFSVWNAVDGALVHDSGDAIEQMIAADPASSANFNCDHSVNDFDSRSDDKGPEPEGLTFGEAYGRPLGFIGLERIGGVLMVDLSDPAAPAILAHVNPRDFAGDPADGSADDLGPEGLTFVPAAASPSGTPLVIVANEVSGTVSIYELVAG